MAEQKRPQEETLEGNRPDGTKHTITGKQRMLNAYRGVANDFDPAGLIRASGEGSEACLLQVYHEYCFKPSGERL